MQYRCALITVSDMSKSVHFYRDILNQVVENDFGENVSFRGGFALHLDSHFEMLTGKSIIRNNNALELYFEHDDLIPVRDALLDERYELVHDIKEQPWRQFVMRVYDPDKHIVEIGESMEHTCYRLHLEGHNIHKIAELTSLSNDFIRNSIQQYQI